MRSQDYINDASDPLCRFYSFPHVGDLLVQAIPDSDVNSILDLGAGSGVLAKAATRRWTKAAVTTVDIDAACDAAMQVGSIEAIKKKHYVLDALDPNLPTAIQNAGLFDAAICNPPFKRLKWRNGYDRVLHDAGLQDSLFCQRDVTAETLFLAQIIRVVRPGGCIGMVVPDSFISGKKTSRLRSELVRNHFVNSVIQLPNRSFVGTEANSYLLIFRNKVRSRSKIRLYGFTKEKGLSDPIEIDAQQAERRMDYMFYSVERPIRFSTLGSLNAFVARGKLTSGAAKGSPHFVFHTTNFREVKDGEFSGPEVPLMEDYAVRDDILLARVHRELESKIALIRRGRFPVSDCVFIIRVAEKYRDQVLSVLRSEEGRARLRSASRGVGARHLTKAELLELPLF